MLRIPGTITAIILAAWLAGSWYLSTSDALNLSSTDLATLLILLSTSAGAFISATYVIWSYIQTNRAFALSQKPALLLFVNNLKLKRSTENPELVHATQIAYKNTTTNTFYDLTIKIQLSVVNRTVDLSDLFTPRMYMAGHDERQRQFVTLDELAPRGIDLNAVTEKGNEGVLAMRYEFSFLGKAESIPVQAYKWERDKQLWSVK